MQDKEAERKWHILWAITDCKVSKVELCLKGMDAKLWVPVFSQLVGQEKEAVPLYPGYYFVECTRESLERMEDRIYGLKARHNLVFMKDENKKPYTLSQEEIDRIKSVEEEEIDEKTLVAGKDRVRVIAGPLKECKGKVIAVKKGFVQISAMMFNREFDSMWIKTEDCEKINED